MTRVAIPGTRGDGCGQGRGHQLDKRHEPDRAWSAYLVRVQEDGNPGRQFGGVEGQECQEQEAQVPAAQDPTGRRRGRAHGRAGEGGRGGGIRGV